MVHAFLIKQLKFQLKNQLLQSIFFICGIEYPDHE